MGSKKLLYGVWWNFGISHENEKSIKIQCEFLYIPSAISDPNLHYTLIRQSGRLSQTKRLRSFRGGSVESHQRVEFHQIPPSINFGGYCFGATFTVCMQRVLVDKWEKIFDIPRFPVEIIEGKRGHNIRSPFSIREVT